MEGHSNNIRRTGLSAGLAVYEALSESQEVTSRVNSIFPVYTPSEINAPSICYALTGIDPSPAKTGDGFTTSDAVEVTILCIAPDYPACVDLAETVRGVLEGLQGETDTGMRMSCCRLVGQDEDWQDGAYIKILIFNMTIK